LLLERGEEVDGAGGTGLKGVCAVDGRRDGWAVPVSVSPNEGPLCSTEHESKHKGLLRCSMGEVFRLRNITVLTLYTMHRGLLFPLGDRAQNAGHAVHAGLRLLFC